MKFTTKEFGQPIEILKFNDFKGKACTVSDTGIVADANGLKIVKAGTPINVNGVKETSTYALTADTAIDVSKTYYTVSSEVYTKVASPLVANIATYYEAVKSDVVGILLHDTDVTNGIQPGTYVFEGSIDTKKLTTNGITISDAVKKALPRVTFFD